MNQALRILRLPTTLGGIHHTASATSLLPGSSPGPWIDAYSTLAFTHRPVCRLDSTGPLPRGRLGLADAPVLGRLWRVLLVDMGGNAAGFLSVAAPPRRPLDLDSSNGRHRTVGTASPPQRARPVPPAVSDRRRRPYCRAPLPRGPTSPWFAHGAPSAAYPRQPCARSIARWDDRSRTLDL